MRTPLPPDNRRYLRAVRLICAALFALAAVYVALSYLFPSLPLPRMEVGITRTGMLMNALLGLPLLFLAPIVERLLGRRLDALLHLGFTAFLVGAMLLGNVFGFFRSVPHWDDVLHALSSFLAGTFGAELLDTGASVSDGIAGRLTRALFAFSFAMMIGGVWEIVEFTGDSLLGMNAQRYLSITDGTPLVGHAVLYDTMKDLIVDACGALVSAFLAARKTKK